MHVKTLTLDKVLARIETKDIEVFYRAEPPRTTVMWRRMKNGKYMGMREIEFDAETTMPTIMQAIMAYEDDEDAKRADENWGKNEYQFPRLIAEMVACCEFNENDMTLLCESMDLSRDQVNELFERAQVEWERIKRETT